MATPLNPQSLNGQPNTGTTSTLTSVATLLQVPASVFASLNPHPRQGSLSAPAMPPLQVLSWQCSTEGHKYGSKLYWNPKHPPGWCKAERPEKEAGHPRLWSPRLWQEILQVIPPHSAPQDTHRWEAVRLHMEGLRLEVPEIRRADAPHEEAHWGPALPVQDVWEGVLSFRPPGDTPEETWQWHLVRFCDVSHDGVTASLVISHCTCTMLNPKICDLWSVNVTDLVEIISMKRIGSGWLKNKNHVKHHNNINITRQTSTWWPNSTQHNYFILKNLHVTGFSVMALSHFSVPSARKDKK